jgi:cell division protein FtsB
MKSDRKNNLYAQALMAAVVLVGLYFMGNFVSEVVHAQHLANQVELGRKENERLQAENRQLARDQQYYESDAYVQLRARTDLGLRGPDETVVYPLLTPGPASAAAPAPGAAGPVAGSPPAAPPPAVPARPWDRWLALFLGPAP